MIRSTVSAPSTAMETLMKRLSSTHAAAAVAIAALAASTGCSLFDRGFQPTASYLIAPGPQPKVTGERIGSVMVLRFGAIPPFDGKPFLYRNTDGTWRQDPYAGFIANPSDMVSDALARALEQSGRCEMVGVEGVAMRFDFSIEGVIEAFYSDFSNPDAPRAVVRLRAYLLDRRGGAPRLVDQMSGEGSAPIAAAEPGEVAKAMSAATSAAIGALVEELPKQLPKDSAAAASASGAANAP